MGKTSSGVRLIDNRTVETADTISHGVPAFGRGLCGGDMVSTGLW